MIIRFAEETDSRELLRIYGQYMDTPITFEYVLPSEEEFAGRIRSIRREGYPYLVCEEDGRAVGYAYAHRAFERAAYQWDAELSIYLDKGHTAAGLGGRLYRILMELLALQGVRTAYACVVSPNPKSERLHQRLGFERIGEFCNTGYKNGKWLDVVWFEKKIGVCGPEPKLVMPVWELEEKKVREILQKGLTL